MTIVLTEENVKEKLAEIYKVDVSDVYIEHTFELTGHDTTEHSRRIINVKISVPLDRVQIV